MSFYSINNSGTVDIEEGVLQLSPGHLPGNIFDNHGTWIVRNDASTFLHRLGEWFTFYDRARIELHGAGASFHGLETLRVNAGTIVATEGQSLHFFNAMRNEGTLEVRFLDRFPQWIL